MFGPNIKKNTPSYNMQNKKNGLYLVNPSLK